MNRNRELVQRLDRVPETSRTLCAEVREQLHHMRATMARLQTGSDPDRVHELEVRSNYRSWNRAALSLPHEQWGPKD